MDETRDRYLTPGDVADLLHVPVARVLRWARGGVLPAVVLPGGDLLITAADLAAWLAALRTGPGGGVSRAR